MDELALLSPLDARRELDLVRQTTYRNPVMPDSRSRFPRPSEHVSYLSRQRPELGFGQVGGLLLIRIR